MNVSPWNLFGSGGRIRTTDLRVMSPTSYLTAPPRGNLNRLALFSLYVKQNNKKTCYSPGKRIKKVVPFPWTLSARSSPPCASTILKDMARPSPDPRSLVV